VVEDTGCGMDAATLKSIFEPFSTTKDVGKGTGLGLATVYGIVKQHLGWIEVTSAVGEGTRFSVFLPQAAKKPGALGPAEKPAKLLGGTETILLVEDEPAVRNVSLRFLKRQGYNVLAAATGREALEIWETQSDSIDLLLTDMVMPEGMNGLELSSRLRASRPALLTIICSGYSSDLVDRKRLETLGVAYIPKPCEPATLLRLIRQELDRSKEAAPPPGISAGTPPPGPA